MNTEENLCKKIEEICIHQLTEAIEGNGHYKAKYVKEKDTFEKIKEYNSIEEYARNHIETLLKPDEYKNCNDIFRRLLISGQNRNRMPKVIKFMEREEQFKKILCGTEIKSFNYKEILQRFCNDTRDKELLNKFKENFKIKESSSEADNKQKNYKGLWHQYALFIIDAALFMKNICENTNSSLNEFKTNLNGKVAEKKDDFAVPKYVASKISGIGFTLACDFLKEIGYPMAKPDTHIMEFLRKNYPEELSKKVENIHHKKNNNLDAEEIAAVEVMNNLAAQNQCSVYALDKLIWLCCSGNYYSKGDFHGITVESKSLRDLFLEAYVKNL